MGDELMRGRAAWLVIPAIAAALGVGCSQNAPKRYPLHGQVLAVDVTHQQLTIKHDDIPGFMPGMTMSYPVAAASLMQGRTTLITFVYTRCPLPNFCPLMDQHFETLQRSVSDDPTLKGRVKLISVSIDPAFDTPAVLAAHAAHVHADPAVWTFLTGDVGTIDHLAAQFGVGVLRDPQNATNLTHNLRTTLIGADGHLVKIYSGNDWTPGEVLADVRQLLALKT